LGKADGDAASPIDQDAADKPNAAKDRAGDTTMTDAVEVGLLLLHAARSAKVMPSSRARIMLRTARIVQISFHVNTMTIAKCNAVML
jgi:hypothetical protein